MFQNDVPRGLTRTALSGHAATDRVAKSAVADAACAVLS
jgi:hypothetical protein